MVETAGCEKKCFLLQKKSTARSVKNEWVRHSGWLEVRTL